MKLVTFEVATVLGRFCRIGVVHDGHIVDLNAAYAWLLNDQGEPEAQRLADAILPPDMLQFLRIGDRAMDAAREVDTFISPIVSNLPPENRQWNDVPEGLNGASLVFQAQQVRILAPLPKPQSLRDFITFEAHVKSGYDRRGQPMPEAWYKYPIYYKGSHTSILGPEDPLVWPRYTQKLDYELELACVIGKSGRDLDASEATRHIVGYTIMNDFSARDIQMEEMTCRLGPAKGKDFGTAIGPYLVTADEVGDPRNLKMTARINGEVWSEGNSGTSHWSFEQMLAHLSNEETIHPGDVIGSGTVGRGCGMELDRYLNPGDVVELEIEKLGVLRNRIITHEEAKSIQGARQHVCTG
jgi:2-keto-4-pentenoate hydratase/2-oxohepta-3-ene-1,7-dioic acid hydratase in catechol pathway